MEPAIKVTEKLPSTSEGKEKAKSLEEWKPKPENRVQFSCSICGLCELTKYGKLDHKTASTLEEVFYIPDPFIPYDIHKTDFRVSDFVVFGSKCAMCKQSVCVAKTCSIFYKHSYCLCCVQRESHAFPKEIIKDLDRRFNAIPRQKPKENVEITAKEVDPYGES